MNRSVLQLIFREGFHCGDTENHQANVTSPKISQAKALVKFSR
jgi:hypothetical protein